MPWVVCTAGDDRGLSFEVREKPQTMGRGNDCDIRLIHDRVSRRHCKVTYLHDILYVEDFNTTNGIQCRGKKVKGQQVKLELDETFALGGDVFAFVETNDQYTDATQDVVRRMAGKSRDGMFEQTYSQTLSTKFREREQKKRFSLRGLLARLFGGRSG